MRIRIKDFGPVVEGAIDLKPLTIFVGPNNSGKSYVAMLVHSIVSTENHAIPLTNAMGDRVTPNYRSFRELYGEASEIVKEYKETSTLEDFFELRKSIKEHIQNLFDSELETSLTGNFGSDLTNLIRTGQNEAKISISGDNGFSASLSNELSVKHARNAAMNSDDKNRLDSDLRDVMDAPLPKIIMDRGDIYLIARRIMRVLAGAILKSARIAKMPKSSFYFPAARSGLLQGHKALSAGLIQNAQFVGTRELRIPRLTGVVSDFITAIMMLTDDRGDFYELGEEMETDILKGHMDLKEGPNGQSHEIFYSTSTSSIPLHRTSSTISEVSPLSLYLKHVARRGTLLIIEEPEAHLHLKNQAIMARYIVKMVRSGFKVLVTTHSATIVEGLGKHMLASKATIEDRKKAGISPEDYLDFDEVAPYVFEGCKESGYCIREIIKDDGVGIPHDDYMNELQDQYNNTVKLEHILAGK